MTVTGIVIKNIIRKLIAGEDYRSEVITLIDAEFLQYVVDFFKRIAHAKLDNEAVTADWYRKELLCNEALSKEEVAVHSGMNIKTISNMYNSASKKIVLEASLEHYDALYNAINNLTEQDDVDVTLTIKLRHVSVDLTLSESLVVINTLAVKRSALRGGLWSTAGKQVEKPLMATLCALFRVPRRFFDQSELPASSREADFYLRDATGTQHRCEVKLMGKGNPESADAVYARGSRVLVANKLSALNKAQMDAHNILWIELQASNGYQRFEQVLNELSIPCRPFTGELQAALDKILPVILSDEVQDSVTPGAILQEQEQGLNHRSELLVELE
ncbi:CfrBI family restriction endonuclease [Candidatus Poribacteria bacterium]|nr:MAG: CfrBI family restriction endonuclease [Candidatus Poribacteria bacterium]